ncbi:MAG: hypothetical protein U5O39_07410 [Gammaproteobacteria bacterium]|nr:hypothetical protein [Gammaproteobacteria bacterium]
MTLEDVDAWHDALTRQLIGLHEAVEAAGDSELDEAIWRYLGDSASRHALPL